MPTGPLSFIGFADSIGAVLAEASSSSAVLFKRLCTAAGPQAVTLQRYGQGPVVGVFEHSPLKAPLAKFLPRKTRLQRRSGVAEVTFAMEEGRMVSTAKEHTVDIPNWLLLSAAFHGFMLVSTLVHPTPQSSWNKAWWDSVWMESRRRWWCNTSRTRVGIALVLHPICTFWTRQPTLRCSPRHSQAYRHVW